MLTQKRLKELLCYYPETGVFVWNVEVPNKPYLKGCEAGYIDEKGYRRIEIDGIAHRSHRLAFLWVLGYNPENSVDHINRVKDDNRWENLREASRQCQGRNCGLVSHNTSGIKGVYWAIDRKRWRVQITVNRKHKRVGNFKCKIEAAAHRYAAEQCLNWNSCDSNSTARRYLLEKEVISQCPVNCQ